MSISEGVSHHQESENPIKPFVHPAFTYDYYNEKLLVEGKEITLSSQERTILEILTLFSGSSGSMVPHEVFNRVLRVYDTKAKNKNWDTVTVSSLRKKILQKRDIPSPIVNQIKFGYKLVS